MRKAQCIMLMLSYADGHIYERTNERTNGSTAGKLRGTNGHDADALLLCCLKACLHGLQHGAT
jgi:hypothetical protein